MRGERITVQGQVQGVGFRPTVWRIATELGLTGDVRNTGEGVEIRLFGGDLDRFVERLAQESPALARVDAIARAPLDGASPEGFAIAPSDDGAARVCITPDTATCPECLAEIRDPFARRYRYPFANCTNCGPRFSIIDGAPYDRAKTTMRAFAICEECRAEYEAPADRRFHAQPIACHVCGPRAFIERLGPGAVHHEAFSMLDDVDACGGMIMNGHIVAVKGVGGFHLACDATNEAAVLRLRARKRRRSKAFALMARDVDIIRRYCEVSAQEEALLHSAAAPIVVLRMRGEKLPDGVAPGLNRLGFMLPYTPMHHLMLRRMTRPVVMTSGNISGQPQCIDNDDARRRLAGVADFALMHDRVIANRIDDSVVRVDLDQSRMLRRARGYAPMAIPLPPGFDKNLQVLAMGAELKNAFCLVKNGDAILSQHMGDLEDAATDAEVAQNLDLYCLLYGHAPQIVAVDAHPDYRSTQRGRVLADAAGAALVETQHHHGHVAACMAENGSPLGGAAVLGIALDGTGFGPDGTVWGGEFLACTYAEFQRLGCFKPVALPGGAQAIREPWRNAYAHLIAQMGWAEFAMNFDALDLFAKMSTLPRSTLDAMIAKRVNAPLSSSCGRLFDAAAAMCGLAWDRQDYEAQAAMAFEAAIDVSALTEPDDLAYPFSIPRLGEQSIPYIEPLAAWRALLGDLHLATPVGVIAARFHRGLARAIVAMAEKLSGEERRFPQVALTGGCFQNATLFNLVHRELQACGFDVLSHKNVPANDGGLALGQAVIALAQHRACGD